MARERLDEWSLEVEAETGAVFGAGASYGGSQKVQSIWGCDVSSVNPEYLTDEAYRIDGGANERIVGLSHERISVPFTTHGEGLTTAAGSGTAPTATALSVLMGSVFQRAADSITGDVVKAGSSPRTTSGFQGNTNDRGNPANGGYAIVGVTISGAVQWRPYVYTPASDEFTLKMVTSAAPDEGAVLYGGIWYTWLQKWSGAVTNTLGCRLVGNDTNQHRELKGAIASFGIPELKPTDPVTLNWTLRAASYDDLFSDTRAVPTAARGYVTAGGQFLLADAGSAKTGLAIRLYGMSLELPGYQPDEDCNNSTGCAGWTRTKDPMTLRLTVPHDQAMPSGISAATYRDLLQTGGADNALQFLAAFGCTPGRTVAFWCPSWRLVDVETPVDTNGIDTQTLVLQPISDGTTPHLVGGVA